VLQNVSLALVAQLVWLAQFQKTIVKYAIKNSMVILLLFVVLLAQRYFRDSHAMEELYQFLHLVTTGLELHNQFYVILQELALRLANS
jgi:hypothetical protein